MPGPLPKPPEQRARRNKDPHPLRVIEVEHAKQPTLPRLMPDGEPWPAQTRKWWRIWGASPLTEGFTETDWSELLDTAILHARFWSGDVKVAAELRLRTAKHGATAEDRARLRIQFAAAEKAEQAPPQTAGSARERRGPLRAV